MTLKWRILVKNLAFAVAVLAACPALGWWWGDQAFEQQIWRLRATSGHRLFGDMAEGTAKLEVDPAVEELLSERRKQGFNAQQAFRLGYAVYGFYAGAAITISWAALMLALEIRRRRNAVLTPAARQPTDSRQGSPG